jgi:hypothetical protein
MVFKKEVSMKQVRHYLVLIVITVVFGGCIRVDGSPSYYNSEETVIYINRTGHVVDNYINGEYVGAVQPYDRLYVYSHYLDGTNEYHSVCRDCNLEWGPTFFTLHDGEVFRIYLEQTGMYFETQ